MYKISLERVLEARRRPDKSSRGTDEEYYNNLFNEWKTLREYNFLSAQNLVPAKPPESDWLKLGEYLKQTGITVEEALKILQEVREKEE